MALPLGLQWKDVVSPLGTVTAAFVGVVGSWVAFVRYPRQADSLKFRLKYVEDQLANFYGPLLGLLKEFEAAHSTVVAIFALPPATHIDAAYCATNAGVSKQEVSKVFRTHIFPYNERILSLVSGRRHLHGPFPPASLQDFVIYAGEAHVLTVLDHQLALDPASLGSGNSNSWPPALVAEVEAKVAFLSGLQVEYRLRLDHHPAKHIVLRNRFEVQAHGVWRGPYFWIELAVFARRAGRGEGSPFGDYKTQDAFLQTSVRELGHFGVTRLIPEGGMLHFSELEVLVLRRKQPKR